MEQIPITVVQYDNSHIQNVMQTWVMSKPATMWKQKITHNRHIFHIYLGCSHWPKRSTRTSLDTAEQYLCTAQTVSK